MKTNTRSHLCRVLNTNGRVGGVFVCVLLVPVWRPLHSVEADVFIPKGSDGESVKNVQQRKANEDKPAHCLMNTWRWEHGRTPKDEFEWESRLRPHGSHKSYTETWCQHPFQTELPQTHENSWAQTGRGGKEIKLSSQLSLPPLVIHQLNYASIFIPTASQNTKVYLQYFWQCSDFLEQRLY